MSRGLRDTLFAYIGIGAGLMFIHPHAYLEWCGVALLASGVAALCEICARGAE